MGDLLSLIKHGACLIRASDTSLLFTPCRSWKSASRITSSFFSGTAAASSAPSTRTRPTLRRLSSSPARGRVPSAPRWWTNSTSTARTASSSPSSRPSLCQSAWTPWPSTTTSGRSRGRGAHAGSDGAENSQSLSLLLMLVGRDPIKSTKVRVRSATRQSGVRQVSIMEDWTSTLPKKKNPYLILFL